MFFFLGGSTNALDRITFRSYHYYNSYCFCMGAWVLALTFILLFGLRYFIPEVVRFFVFVLLFVSVLLG